MANKPTNLSPDEQALVNAVMAGEKWVGVKSPDGALPKVQASTIQALCLGEWDNAKPTRFGVRIVDAEIVGELDLSFATVPAPLALTGCRFAECPDFMQATLALLILNRSTFEKGFKADCVKIAGDLSCDNIETKGEVGLLDAGIGGQVSFVEAKLTGGGGQILSMDGAKITGSLFCTAIDATGKVGLLGADIGGQVVFEKAKLTGELVGQNLTVKGDFFVRGDDAKIIGNVRLLGADIKGVIVWKPTHWQGTLHLSHAHAALWQDNWNGDGWASSGEGRIVLTGFAYDRFSDKDEAYQAKSRIGWIEHSLGDDYQPGPYEALIKVYRADGDDDRANDVGLAKLSHRARHRGNPKATPKFLRRARHRLVDWVLHWTVGFGYRPARGAYWLGSFWFVGWMLFHVAGPFSGVGVGVIKPADATVYYVASGLQRCGNAKDAKDKNGAFPEKTCVDPVAPAASPTTHRFDYKLPIEYTPFSAFWYSLDTLLPLIDLGQERAWAPSPLGDLWEDFWGWAVLAYLYIHILAGWLLATLTVSALTGVIKKD